MQGTDNRDKQLPGHLNGVAARLMLKRIRRTGLVDVNVFIEVGHVVRTQIIFRRNGRCTATVIFVRELMASAERRHIRHETYRRFGRIRFLCIQRGGGHCCGVCGRCVFVICAGSRRKLGNLVLGIPCFAEYIQRLRWILYSQQFHYVSIRCRYTITAVACKNQLIFTLINNNSESQLVILN